jgi:hypothetical protein
MHSNGWSSTSSLWKTSHFPPTRSQRHLQTHSELFLENHRPSGDEGMLLLKTSLLTKKLKQKPTFEKTLDHSRYTTLKSTKCPEFGRVDRYSELDGSTLKIKK